ncbi:MAG: hypothetical protein ABIJ21_06875 [Nanoarchaeota archaeon]
MQDKTLLRIAIFGSILGLIILALLVQFTHLEETSISAVKADGKSVAIAGKVAEVKVVGQTTILTIEQQCTIPVVVFDEIAVTEGDVVRIVGSSQEYLGKPEIIAERVEKK